MKTLPCKWVFKVKYDQDENVQRLKARLVAKGFKHVTGVDLSETFALVAKQSVRSDFVCTFVGRHLRTSESITRPQRAAEVSVKSRALTLRTFVGCHLRSCVLHARMSGEYAHSMAALSTVQPWSILVGTVHCRNGHRPSRTLVGPILLEGTRPKLGRRPVGIRPPRDQDLSTFNTLPCSWPGDPTSQVSSMQLAAC